MAVERPTFSESWYRLAELRPSLRSTVQVYRQHFRGQMWHVIQDPASNQFYRLNTPAYTFVSMLDGRRTVAEVWRVCNERLGDEAPTQGEAIQLLGQLYTSNLLQAELPPDAEGLLQRYRKRRVREVQGYLTNLLFIRIPLIDPDRFLERWVGVFGGVFSWVGLAIWLGMVAVGLYFVIDRIDDLLKAGEGIFDPGNLPLLYASLVLVKVFHEFGHAFACKRFGRKTGTGGEVHQMGVMFLVFMPLPYLDASSAWAFRSKWQRVIVGAAGMLIEIAIASVAAVVWANTAKGTLHGICFNIMFLASVSTVLFNGNPLLRYDAYYILSDLTEIPNLAHRARQYIYYLVKRFAWRVKRLTNPAHLWGERIWFVIFGIASTVYRLFIFTMILLFVTKRLPKPFAIVAMTFGVVAAFGWICVPIGKLVRYLATNRELERVRGRAVSSALTVAVGAFVAVGILKFAHHERIPAIVEAADMAVVNAEADGRVEQRRRAGDWVRPDGDPLLRSTNRDMEAGYAMLLAKRVKLDAQRGIALTREPAAVQILDAEIAALDEEIAEVKDRLASLEPRAPIEGVYLAQEIDGPKGMYVRRADPIGVVADIRQLRIRATAGKDVASMVITKGYKDVEIRVKGRPDTHYRGRITRIVLGGQERLPSPALGFQAGGPVETKMDDPTGTKAAERFFEIYITPEAAPIDPEKKDIEKLFAGQRVVVRVTLPPEPLLVQWWRSLSRIIQERFRL